MTASVITDVYGEAVSDDRCLFRLAQALQDAIVLRRARAGTYCHDCDQAPSGRCDDHACDVDLIARYEDDARAVSAAIGQGYSR
jgi:hypothetical protein